MNERPRSKYPKTGKRGAPQAFAHKMWEIMMNETTVAFSTSGTAFVIRDQEKFVKQTLLKYFRHQKFSSFQRQLNLYGFRKIHRGPDNGGYKHPCFLRGHPELLTSIRRSTQHNHVRGPSSRASRHHDDESDEEDFEIDEDEEESDGDDCHHDNDRNLNDSDETPPDYDEVVKSLKHMSSSSSLLSPMAFNKRKLRRVGSSDNNNNTAPTMLEAIPVPPTTNQLKFDFEFDIHRGNNNHIHQDGYSFQEAIEIASTSNSNSWMMMDLKSGSEKEFVDDGSKLKLLNRIATKMAVTSIDSGSIDSAFNGFGQMLADASCGTPPLGSPTASGSRPVSLKRLLSGNLDMLVACNEPYNPDIDFDELFVD